MQFDTMMQCQYQTKESVENFVEFLQFRVRDIHFKNHLENSAKNATYISKESQNDFIKHAREAISDRIIEEVTKVVCIG